MIAITSQELLQRRLARKVVKVKKPKVCMACGKSAPDVSFRRPSVRKCDWCITSAKYERQKRWLASRDKKRQEWRAKGVKRKY